MGIELNIENIGARIALVGLGWIIATLLAIRVIGVVYQNRHKDLRKHDRVIELVIIITSLISVALASATINVNILKFYLASCLIGLLIEFLVGNVFSALLGSSVFHYYKGNILHFTSWYMLPFWGWGGMYFLMIFKGLQFTIELEPTRVIVELLGIVTLVALLLTLITGLARYFLDLALPKSQFNWGRYSIISLGIIAGLSNFAFVNNKPELFLYYLGSAFLGFIAEGLLSRLLSHWFGERVWMYRRLRILQGGSSWLVLPFWGLASLVTLIIATATEVI